MNTRAKLKRPSFGSAKINMDLNIRIVDFQVTLGRGGSDPGLVSGHVVLAAGGIQASLRAGLGVNIVAYSCRTDPRGVPSDMLVLLSLKARTFLQRYVKSPIK
jgi:hypothetical protein